MKRRNKITRFNYFISELNSRFRVLFRKLFKVSAPYFKVNHKKVIKNQSTANAIISDMILSNKPFMVARFGSVELSIINEYYQIILGKRKRFSDGLRSKAKNNAGIFSNDDDTLIYFSKSVLTSSSNMDIVGVWNDRQELFTIKKLDITIIRLNVSKKNLQNLEWK